MNKLRKQFNKYIDNNTPLKNLFDDLSMEDGIMLQVFFEGFAKIVLEQSHERVCVDVDVSIPDYLKVFGRSKEIEKELLNSFYASLDYDFDDQTMYRDRMLLDFYKFISTRNLRHKRKLN